jgi:acyl-coenzyme A thioesterase PaaI-like protein
LIDFPIPTGVFPSSLYKVPETVRAEAECAEKRKRTAVMRRRVERWIEKGCRMQANKKRTGAKSTFVLQCP